MKCAIDFETYYDSEYGLKEMSAFQYCRDPRFDAYCVSFAREDGKRFAGHPSEFDWSLAEGCEIFMHNAQFDGQVLRRLQADGKAPKLGIEIYDTADMAAYFGSRRNLQSAARNFLGQTLQKDTRDRMKGKPWEMVDNTKLGAELLQYAQQDADTTLALGMKLLPQWPTVEQVVSKIGRESGWRGLPIDLEYVGLAHRHLQELTFNYLESIPWYPKEKALSVPAMREEARKNGMWFPASLDKRDAKAEEWFAEYGEKYSWVQAIRDFRRANTLANRVKNLWEGREGSQFPFELLYFGAGTTGRWSGGGVVLRRRGAGGKEEGGNRFNPQNMPREAMYGVDLRYCLMAPEGKMFYICDYGQIENRLLLWRAGDKETLELIRGGVHPYMAYAIKCLGAPKDMDKKHSLYPMSKALVLGAGYQAGAKAFVRAAKALAGFIITEDRAAELVREWRANNPKIVAFWKRHQMHLQLSANAQDPTHEVELASGRVLTYFNPRNAGTNDWGLPQVEVEYTMGEEPDKIYGGLLTENEIQATARDVLRDGWAALVKAGYDVPLTVHDEYVIIGPDTGCEEFKAGIRDVVSKSSPWLEDCPMKLDISVSKHYEK